MSDITGRLPKVLISAITDSSGFSKFILAVLAFIAPLQSLVFFMLFFIIGNMASAIYLAVKTENKKKKEDRKPVMNMEKFWKTVEKILTYMFYVCFCYIVDVIVLKIQPADAGILTVSFTNTFFLFACFYEFFSMTKNLGKATGNKIYKVIENLTLKKITDKETEIGKNE